MRRYCSVLGLAARCTFWKVLAATLVSCGAEAALFLITLHGWPFVVYGPDQAWRADNPMGLEGLIAHSRIALCFGLGLAAVCGALALLGWEGSGCRTGYTLRRLRVGEKPLTLLWGGYGTLCLLFYWAAHLGTVLALGAAAMPHLSERAASPLALFLACWRSPYLHALLPLEDVWLWGRNLLLCAALGLGTAAFSRQRRHGHRAWGWIPLALGAALLFPLPMGAFPFQGLDPAFLPYLETEVEVYTGSGSPVPGLMAFLLTGGSAAVLINAALMICGREPFYEN